MEKSKELQKAIKALKSKCKDADFDSLIEKVLLLKEEEIKQNSLVYVPKTDNVETIEQSAYRLSKTDDAIVYRINGFEMVIRPNLGIYHSPYSTLFELSKDYDNLSDEYKEAYQNLLFPAVLVPQITTFAFSLNNETGTPDFLVELLKLTNNYFAESVKNAQNIAETAEDLDKNEKFERDEMIRDTLKGTKND